jgi:hypothetical protein
MLSFLPLSITHVTKSVQKEVASQKSFLSGDKRAVLLYQDAMSLICLEVADIMSVGRAV